MGHTQCRTPPVLLDICDCMKNPNHVVRRFNVNDASFKFDETPLKCVPKPVVQSLKKCLMSKAKDEGFNLVMRHSRPKPDRNCVCKIAFGCVGGKVVN